MKKLCLLLGLLFVLCSRTANAQSGLFIAPNSSPITSPVTGQSWLFNSTNYTVGVWTGSAYRLVNTPFSNYLATNNPTSSNDNTQGYVVGSLWVNQTTQGIYMATSVATSAAVWTGINAVVTTIPLNDLQQGGATNGQSLIWNNTSGVWNPGNPAIALSQLTQSSATNGQGIIWNSTDSAWEASNLGSGTVTTFSSGNLSPLFTASVANATTAPALSFSLTNAAGNGVLSNTSGSSGVPAYNVLSLTAGTGLAITSSGLLAQNPTVSLSTPVVIANGGTGAATAGANKWFGNPTGGTASPGFNSLTAADLPTTIVNSVTNSSGVLVTGAISGQVLTLSNAAATVPIANGGTGQSTSAAAITALIAGSPTSGQTLEYDGSNWVPATVTGTGTVTSFSAGNLSPYFTTSVATSTTTPVLSFTASTIAANSILSNTTSSSAIPSANTLSVSTGVGLTGGGNLTTSPTISLTVPVSNSNLGNTVVTSTGSLSPLFTANITSQTLGFVLSNFASHTFLGNNTGSSAAPSAATIGVGDLPSAVVASTTNAAPFFTSAISGQALTFSVSNATGNSILSNTSGSPGTPAYNVLSITAGTGLTGGGDLTSNPTISVSNISPANGGTGSTLFTFGTATFATAGSIAVVDTSITSSSIVTVTQVGSTPLAAEYSVAVTAGVGFTIYSTNVASTATVFYIRVN